MERKQGNKARIPLAAFSCVFFAMIITSSLTFALSVHATAVTNPPQLGQGPVGDVTKHQKGIVRSMADGTQLRNEERKRTDGERRRKQQGQRLKNPEGTNVDNHRERIVDTEGAMNLRREPRKTKEDGPRAWHRQVERQRILRNVTGGQMRNQRLYKRQRQ